MLNKGKIISAQHIGVKGQLITSVGLTVTREMMPSFRLVAFYSIPWANNEEVVSDSVWVDVADSCAGGVRGHHTTNSSAMAFSLMYRSICCSSRLFGSSLFLNSHLHAPRSSRILSQLKVGPVDGIPRDYFPGKSFRFQIQGDPGAKVSLVAVDNAVYLLRRDRLTQRKVCFMVTLEVVKATTDSQTSRFMGKEDVKIFTPVFFVVLLIVCLH